MSISVVFNGTTYSIPEAQEEGWASLTNFLVDVGTNAATTSTLKSGLRVAITTPVTVANTDFTVVTNLTTPGAVVVNLPVGQAGRLFAIVDGKGDAATNNVTINANGAETINGSASFVLNSNNSGILLQYNSSNSRWNIIGNFEVGGLTRTSVDQGANRVQNKDLEDSTTKIVDNADATKAIRFEVSGVGTGTTRVITAINADMTLVGLTNAQTLTNKTLTSPAITTPTGIVKGDVGLGNVDNTSDATKNAASVVLTNKDIDGGTASNTSRITIPKATTATLTGLTRKEATIVYDTDLDKPFYDNGSALVAFGSGSGGAGELNAVLNPSASDNTTGWAGTGTCTVTRVATGGVLEPIIPSVLRLAGGSAADYVRYRFTMPEGLWNTKLKWEFYQEDVAGASGNWKIEIYSNSASNYGGTYTEFPLSTDASGNTLLSNGEGKFTTTFDSNSSLYYELRYVRVSGAAAIDITNVIVGPGIQPQGAVVGPWISYTPTGTWTNGTYTGFYRRIGDSIECQTQFNSTSTQTGTYTVSLPSGLTFNTAALPSGVVSNNTNMPNSFGTFVDVSASSYPITARYNNSTSVTAATFDDATNGSIYVVIDGGSPVAKASGDQVLLTFIAPIAEWAGSGTINLAQNDVEFISAGPTWDANSTTTAYGPAGSVMSGSLSASRTKQMQLLTPLQPGDMLTLQYKNPVGVWINQADSVYPFIITPSLAFGGYINWSNTTSTQVEVVFGQYAQPGTTYNSATGATNWNTSVFDAWRVVKSKGGQAVGFGIVSENASGLMPATNTNLDNASATRLGLKAYAHGGSYVSGLAPTIALSSGGGTLSSVTGSSFIPYQMQDGNWRMRFNFRVVVSSTARTIADFTVVGITYKNAGDLSLSSYTGVISNAFAVANSNTLEVFHSSTSTTFYAVSGDVDLASKPTWAY